MLRYKIYVINLARSPERLDRIKDQLDAIGKPFERIDAIDGRGLSDEYVEQVSPSRIVRKTYHRALSKAEIACSLSHRKAWQQIIDDEMDFGIVLEDDLELLDNFPDVLNLLAGLPHADWDFIKLFPLRRGGEKNIHRRFDYGDHTFVTYHKFPLGCQAQAISGRGARSLLHNLPYVTQPVDGQLKSWWEAHIYPFGLLPYCVTTDIDGVSDINPGGALEKMKQDRYTKIANKVTRSAARLLSTPELNRRFREFTRSLVR